MLLRISNLAKLEYNTAGIGDTRNAYRLGQQELREKATHRQRRRCEHNNNNNNNNNNIDLTLLKAYLKGRQLKK
jgi:hypothetical protein